MEEGASGRERDGRPREGDGRPREGELFWWAVPSAQVHRQEGRPPHCWVAVCHHPVAQHTTACTCSIETVRLKNISYYLESTLNSH